MAATSSELSRLIGPQARMIAKAEQSPDALRLQRSGGEPLADRIALFNKQTTPPQAQKSTMPSRVRGTTSGAQAGTSAAISAAPNPAGGMLPHLSKSDRALPEQAQRKRDPAPMPDTFDFCAAMMMPASDAGSITQFQRKLEEQRSAAAASRPRTQPNVDQIPPTRAAAVANAAKRLDSTRVEAIYGMVQSAVAADEAHDYERAHDLYRELVDVSMRVMPSLSEQRQTDLRRQIVRYIERMTKLQRILLDQSVMSLDESSASISDPSLVLKNSADAENRPELANRAQPVRLAAAAKGTNTEPRNEKTGSASSAGSIERAMKERQSRQDRVPSHQPQNAVATGNGEGHRRTSSAASFDKERLRQELQALQDRFDAMVLGGDTSGARGQGTAYSLSSAITNLDASAFGEFKRLEPLPTANEQLWRTELSILLRPLQLIVERAPEIVKLPDGSTRETLVDKPRRDIALHLPRLHDVDRQLRAIISETNKLRGTVHYVRYCSRRKDTTRGVGARQQLASATSSSNQVLQSRGTNTSSPTEDGGGDEQRWWVDTPELGQGGLGVQLRETVEAWNAHSVRLQRECRDISREVLDDMSVPEQFMRTLPEHARDVFRGEFDDIIRELSGNPQFTVQRYLSKKGMWDETGAQRLTSALEKAQLVWKTRLLEENGDKRRRVWNFSKVDRAKTMHLMRTKADAAVRALRRAFPFMVHTELDEARIRFNTDIGKAGLESFGRALESRSARIKQRVEQLLREDERVRRRLS